MARPRPYRRRWLFAPAIAASSIAQGGALIGYEVTRPEPKPTLTIRLDGDAEGQVLVTRAGDTAPILRCAKTRCSIELEPGTKVQLSSVPGEDSVFGGYSQYPMRTPAELVPLLGDPLAHCGTTDAVEAATNGIDVLQCPITVAQDTDVAVEFTAKPDSVDVRLEPEPPAVAALDPTMKAPDQPPPPPAPIEAEKLDNPVTVAIVPPEQMAKIPPIPPPPPPPQEQAKEQPKQPPPPPPPNMVMVEVKDDKHEVDKAPDDATKLSDKNRNVDEETRAKETNLDKESDGQTVASRESDDRTSENVGGPDDKIRQNEETKPTTDDRIEESDHSGKDEVAKGVVKGDEGDKGEEGTGEKDPGLFAMRGIAGRGSVYDQKDGKKLGKKGLPGINTPMVNTDYERLMGKDKVDEERQIAARRMGSRKGRWEKKLDAIKSSLENFVPDVRPGNQTALKTRAHPYAIYIARMHRRIHELWGFGFLDELDNRAADDPLNDPNLWTNLEISVNQDGTLHKVTIAKTSGKTEFDVAAVDTIISAGPFESTPEAIRSVDGRIYLRWGMYRNWRQCGTFNVEPYILTEVPAGNDVGVLDGGNDGKPMKQPRITPKHHPIGEGVVTPDDGKSKDKVSPDSSVTDKHAVFAANQFISGFATANVDKLVKLAATPFYANGKVAAETAADLKDMFGNLVVESGAMKEWKLLKPSEYNGGGKLPDGNVVVQVQATNGSFAIVMTKTPSGEYRATQLAR